MLVWPSVGVVEGGGNVPDLKRYNVRGVIGWPAMGEAVIVVFVPAIGAGLGLSERKSGWTRSSAVEYRVALLRLLEVGLEKFGGLDGGEETLALREELGFHSTDVAVSEEMATGEEGRNGPSRALAGDSGLLPGIVSKPGLGTGDEDTRVARTS